MTQLPTSPVNGLADDDPHAALRQEAAQDEHRAFLESALQAAQARCQALNLEVRLRDQRILELERELAELPAQPSDYAEGVSPAE